MALKFYLHNATTADTGTLPAAGASVSATTPTLVATGGDTNRSMNATIGTSQASNTLATNASTTAQSGLIARFCSAPIAAQTIASQTIAGAAALSESSTNSAFSETLVLAVWRPGTGAVVGRLFDLAGSLASTASESAWSGNLTTSSTAVTAQAGDILVYERWRTSAAQSMATSYSNVVYYDGTTEASATTNAAYILFANDVALAVVAAAYIPTPDPIFVQRRL